MDFKEALKKFHVSTWNQDDSLEETRRRWIYDLNIQIKQFLAPSQADFAQVIKVHPELGQLLAAQSRDDLVMTSPELFRLFAENLLWFYRPASTDPLEMKASEWARKLLRSMVVFPNTDVLNVSPNINFRTTRLSTEKLLQMLQRILRNHLRRRTCTDVRTFRQLARDGLALLRNKHSLDVELLQTVISSLPSVQGKLCPNEVRLFYRNLEQELSSGSIDWPEILHEKLSEKYLLHVENEIIKLVEHWVNELGNLGFEVSSSWLISAASHNKQLFQASISILNVIFLKTGMDSSIAEFVHQFLQEVRSARSIDSPLQGPCALNSIAELYPERLSPLVYLLDITASDLDGHLREQHALFLAKMFTSAIADHSVGQEEATFLLLQFPEWWDCIEQLSEQPDPSICAQFEILWSMLRRTCYIHSR